MERDATAIALYRADYADSAAVLEWQSEIDAAAARWPGFVETQHSLDAGGADRAAAVTYHSRACLQDWLDSGERQKLLRRAAALGINDTAEPIVLVQGERPPPGVAVFVHSVAPHREEAFQQTEARLREECRSFPGLEAQAILPPGKMRGVWISLVRFHTEDGLTAWLGSPVRAALLGDLRAQLDQDFEQYTRSTPFGSIVRFRGDQAEVTPNWKSAMVVLMVLYPTVMLLSRFLGPVLSDLGADPGLTLWLSQVVSISLLTWLLMPLATRAFRRFLDPVDGAAIRTTAIGVLALVLIYVVSLVIFTNVQWLQFWDYAD